MELGLIVPLQDLASAQEVHDMSKAWVVAFATHMVAVWAQNSLRKGYFFQNIFPKQGPVSLKSAEITEHG